MPANPFQDGISVAIQGDSSGLNNALGSASAGLTSFKKKVGLAGGALAALAGGAMAGAINEARKFQSEMVELEKVTNPETAREMSGAIKEMAETIPLAQTELAQIASDAGRFGIEGPKNIESFTRAVSKMATATDISAQKSGEALAKLAELTGTPITKVENLGSSINELSNNFATSAQEIVDSMLRSSAAMSQFGLSQTEIAGFSAALNAVSESSERAGTRMRRLVQEISNPKKVGDMARALGMNVDQYRAMQENNPAGLLRQMAKGMKEGGQTADVLNKNLSTTSRQALSGLGQNLDGVNRALDMSAKSFEENTSLQKEFDTATQTFNSRVQILKNRLRNVAITIGNQLLPATTKLVNLLARGVEKFSEWNQKTNGLTGALTLIAGLVTGLATAAGVLINALGGVAAIMGGASTVAGALGTALTILTGPIGLVIAAVGLLAAAFATDFMGIRTTTVGALEAIRGYMQDFGVWIAPYVKKFLSVLKEEFALTAAAWKSAISDFIEWAEPYVDAFLGYLSGLWGEHGDTVMGIAEALFGGLKSTFDVWFDVLLDVVRLFFSVFRGDFEGAKDAVIGIAETLAEGVIDMFQWLYDALVGNSIIPDMLSDIISAIRGFKGRALSAGKGLIGAFVRGIKSKIGSVKSSVNSAVQAARDRLPGSDAKEGPLSDLTKSGEALPETFAEGIESNLRTVRGASMMTAQAAAPTAQAQAGGGSIEINVDARGSANPRETRRQGRHGVKAALEAHNIRR